MNQRTNKARLKSLWLSLIVSWLSISAAFSQQAEKPGTLRPLTADDLARMEQVGASYYSPRSFSPDGQWLAYVLVRPKATATNMQQVGLLGGDRSDVWLAPLAGGEARNLTKGESDGSGYFMPSWSPDGKRLAMLSTRGGNLRLWVWDRESGQLRMLSERGVNLWYGTPYLWVSNDRLFCAVLPEGERPKAMKYLLQTPETAMREWPKAWSGKETTASVVESGAPPKAEGTSQGQLLLINASTGASRIIATGTFGSLKLSPAGRHVVFLKRTSRFQPDPSLPLPSRTMLRFATMGYQAMVADVEGNLLTSDPIDVKNVYATEWSKDGTELAIIGEEPHVPEINPTVYIYTLATRKARKAVDDTLDPFAIVWSTGHELLVLANWKNHESIEASNRRTDWWLVRQDGSTRLLTAGMKSVPSQAIAAPGGAFLGVADGNLWQVAADGGNPQKLSVGLDGQITSIVWPTATEIKQGPGSRLVVAAKTGESRTYYLIDLTTGSKVEIRKPDEAARIIDFNAESGRAVMTADTRSGTYLWLSRPGAASPVILVEANTFLRGIAEGERRQIEYRSLDGRTLKGWLILPVGYREGEKYPLITWVYPDQMSGDLPPSNTDLNLLHSLNLQLLSAHGYAVLLPSIPLKPPGSVSEVYMELANGTLPAVDKVIEMGIADPKRLGVMGHSWGGYATYCLITQTNRFQAAVSLAGSADYASYYGTFDAGLRYTNSPQNFLKMYDIEGTSWFNLRMGMPPWKDMGYYLRNSPMFYVERVETPVMIIQGDLDFVPIQQGEQFFNALYRQNKRARFVRYWGEGHLIESTANIRDMWQQVYAWLDEFLKPIRNGNIGSNTVKCQYSKNRSATGTKRFAHAVDKSYPSGQATRAVSSTTLPRLLLTVRTDR